MIKYEDNFTRKTLAAMQKELAAKHPNNMFDHIMSLLNMSKYTYGIKFVTRGGLIKNLNRMEDDRWAKLGVQKTTMFMPPRGYDAYVEIDISLRYLDYETRTKHVNIINVVFHELFEAYMMTNVGLLYQQAHEYSGIQEKILMQQIPDLTQFAAAGGMLINEKYA